MGYEAACCSAILTPYLCRPRIAQDDATPASRDDIILDSRTSQISHDSPQGDGGAIVNYGGQQLFHDQLLKEKGTVPTEFDSYFAKAMGDLVKNMPVDEIEQAMIPVYQRHFTKSDIEAMNSFYSSPVGQKVLEQLPIVMQEGMQSAMPTITKYLAEWKQRVQHDMKEMETNSARKPTQRRRLRRTEASRDAEDHAVGSD